MLEFHVHAHTNLHLPYRKKILTGSLISVLANLLNLNSSHLKIFTNLSMLAYIIEYQKSKFASSSRRVHVEVKSSYYVVHGE